MNRKFAVLAFAAACSWIVLMGPASAQDSQNQPNPHAKQPSKIAYLIQDRIKKIQDHLAAGRPLSPEAAAHFSDNLLRVTSAGELEVEFHAAREVGNGEKAALRAFGATILASTQDFVWPRGTKRPQGLGIIAPPTWVLSSAKELRCTEPTKCRPWESMGRVSPWASSPTASPTWPPRRDLGSCPPPSRSLQVAA